MTRLLALPLLLAAFAVPPATADDPKGRGELKGPRWTPLTFQVQKPLTEGEHDLLGLNNDKQGTRVGCRLDLPGVYVVGIDSVLSELESFTDDKGTDLIKDPLGIKGVGGRLDGAGVLAYSYGSQTGKSCIGIFHAPGWPAAGAVKVRIKGRVTVVVGKGGKEVEKRDVALKGNIDLPVGTLKLEYLGFGVSGNHVFRYRGSRPITRAMFLDSEGKEIPCRLPTSSFWSSTLPRYSDQRFSSTFMPKTRGAFRRCTTVRLTYAETVEDMKVPVDLEVGLGL